MRLSSRPSAGTPAGAAIAALSLAAAGCAADTPREDPEHSEPSDATAQIELADPTLVEGPGGTIDSFSFSADSRTLAVLAKNPVDPEGDLRMTMNLAFWDTGTWEANRSDDSREGSGGTHLVEFSPDGGFLVAARGPEPTVALDASTGERIATLLQQEITGSVAITADDSLLAASGGEGHVELWDTAAWQQTHTLDYRTSGDSMAFSPDGELLAMGSRHPENTNEFVFVVVETASWTEVAELELIDPDHPDLNLPAITVDFSPDGDLLAAGMAPGADPQNSRSVAVWDTGTWEEVAGLTGHASEVGSVAFSPAGGLLATASHDSVRLWDAATWAEITVVGETIDSSADGYWSTSPVEFSPDGTMLGVELVHPSEGSKVAVWELP